MADLEKLKSENLKLRQSLEDVNETLALQEDVNKNTHKINVDVTGKQANIFKDLEEIYKSIDNFRERFQKNKEDNSKHLKFIGCTILNNKHGWT